MDESTNARSTAGKNKERRPPHGQNEGQPRRNSKQGLLKRDLSQLIPPDSVRAGSSVNKVLNEANKIVKIGMEKEFAILEKNNTLQSSNDTIDNLRKNILHLQMEYEKLDQNYQREISHRAELVKRMDATKEVVDSAVQQSDILSGSMKQLEDDKFKLVEFYDLIYEKQKEISDIHEKLNNFIREQEHLVKAKIDEVGKAHKRTSLQNTEIFSSLNRKLSYANDKLKVMETEHEKLESQNQGLKYAIDKLEESAYQYQNQNDLLQEDLAKFKGINEKLKSQTLRYRKILKSKKKELFASRNKNKNLKKSLSKAQTLQEKYFSSIRLVELKNDEWEDKYERQREEEGIKCRQWEAEKADLFHKLTTLETERKDLENSVRDLTQRIAELLQIGETKKSESNQLQHGLSKMFTENLKLKENLKKLSEDNIGKDKLISDLEIKVMDFGNDLNSKVAFYKEESEKYQALVKELEDLVNKLREELSLERDGKEKALTAWNEKLKESEKLARQKIKHLEKLLENKTTTVCELESTVARVTSEGQNVAEKLSTDVQNEKQKNEELSGAVKTLKEGHANISRQLERAERQISDLEGRLAKETASKNSLQLIINELRETVGQLSSEMESDKKSIEALEEKDKRAEKELKNLQKFKEENAALKSSIGDLRKALGDAEARVEAYKIVIKKLESDSKQKQQCEEVTRLKLELARLEEGAKLNNENSESALSVSAGRTRIAEGSQRIGEKESTQEVTEFDKLLKTSSTPPQNTKAIISTPRQAFVSTSISSFRTLTPIRKKRDPYEFDSDSSVERLEPDKVVKIYNRPKRESSKRSKAHK